MSDKTQKFLAKLPPQQLKRVLLIIARIKLGAFEGLDAKPLKGKPMYFRVRIGRVRIIFQEVNGGPNKIVRVGNRDDQTYRDF